MKEKDQVKRPGFGDIVQLSDGAVTRIHPRNQRFYTYVETVSSPDGSRRVLFKNENGEMYMQAEALFLKGERAIKAAQSKPKSKTIKQAQVSKNTLAIMSMLTSEERVALVAKILTGK